MAENNPRIEDIIVDCLNNRANEESMHKLQQWLSASDDNLRQFEVLRAVWQERSADPQPINGDEVFDKIWKKGRGGSGLRSLGKHLFFYHFPQVAAAVLLFVIVPLLTFLFVSFSHRGPSRTAFVVKENPASERSRFMLPDGSMVWLNCKSALRYPEDFTARTVELTGEAFFEVKKDTLRPFTVHSANLSTTALGTSFNVAAYPEKNVIEVALITGKVKINESNSGDQLAVLDPGMGLSYDRGDETVTQAPVEPDNVLAWKAGVLVFDGDDFAEFKWKIEQWYGVHITVEGTVPEDWQIRGRFDNEYLSNILEVVSFNKSFQYQLHDELLTIKF